MLDFNDARPLTLIDTADHERRLETLRDRLQRSAPDLVRDIFPRARIQGVEARIGSTEGEPGESLSITLTGDRAGLWFDHATGEGGDAIDLWMATRGYADSDFLQAVADLESWAGLTPTPKWNSPVAKLAKERAKAAPAQAQPDGLPAPSGQWHYLSADGAVLGIVRRYDLPGQFDEKTGKQKKTFRPMNAHGQTKMPDPRPLYRLPHINTASTVVLVEGEKTADALETVGIEATTAMGGARADPAKTDWSPLAGKRVIVWQDNDEAGAGLCEHVRPYLEAIGCSVSAITIPPGKKPTWDAADAIAEGEDVTAILNTAEAAASAAPQTRFRFMTLRELRNLKPPEWRIDGVLPVHGASVIYGAYESFKTFVALDMLLNLAAGRDWMGRATKPCGVAYIAGEGQFGLAARTTGWLAAHGLSDDIPFQLLPEAVALPNAGDIEALCAAVAALPFAPGIIALDTITRMSGGGSLNDEKDVQAYVRGMDALRLRTGAHIMNIGHSGKNRDGGLFGSVVLPGAVETIICVERSGMALTLINEGPKGKQKDGPNFKDIRLAAKEVTFDQAGERSNTLVLQVDDDPVKPAAKAETGSEQRAQGTNQKAILAVLKRANGAPMGATSLSITAKIDPSALAKALRSMVEKGLIVESDQGGVKRWGLA